MLEVGRGVGRGGRRGWLGTAAGVQCSALFACHKTDIIAQRLESHCALLACPRGYCVSSPAAGPIFPHAPRLPPSGAVTSMRLVAVAARAALLAAFRDAV